MPNAFSRFIGRIFSPIIESSIREALSVPENDNTFFIGTRRYDDSYRDRYEYDRTDVLEQCLEAWRQSPLARRIVELTSQYVVGNGFDIKCKDDRTKAFIDQFWDNRLNRMDSRIVELCDELTRTGNLFLLISTDAAGMSYVRAIPATNIDQIISAPNDIEQPIKFTIKESKEFESQAIQAYDHLMDSPSEDGSFKPAILHYAINRPAGAQWGEPDLAPMLVWLRRYSSWLEDRVRLNRFRNAFVYVVTGEFVNEEARKKRQAQLATTPPQPGSVLVCDQSETWSVISPKLEAMDAREDGMAIKKLIASGAGIPLHFLAEPEGTNRTTAESAGGPTFRRFEQRQNYFIYILSDLIRTVASRRAFIDNKINPDIEIKISGADISARDNVAHSIATVNMLNALERLYDMGLISAREILRTAYRFAGEAADIDELIASGTGIDRRESVKPIEPASKEPVDTSTGVPKKSVLQHPAISLER